MNGYEVIGELGTGGFGTVMKCRDKQTGELVAIKTMKARFQNFDQCLELKEVKSLRKIKHENVVRLIKIFKEGDRFSMVFELCDTSLLKQMEQKTFSESEIQSIMKQLLRGISFIHRSGFFHRDIKPDNIMWKDGVLKICDFGLAREIRSMPPYTQYISTRWYRAPELILRDTVYNSPIDIWAAGAIMAELYNRKPLFPGSSEADQIFKVFAVLGTPKPNDWPAFPKLTAKLGIKFPPTPSVPLSQVIPRASPEALDMISFMLQYDPSKRPSAAQLLNHPFFKKKFSAVSSPKVSFAVQEEQKPIEQKPCDVETPKKKRQFKPFQLKFPSNNFNSLPKSGTKSAMPEYSFNPNDFFDDL